MHFKTLCICAGLFVLAAGCRKKDDPVDPGPGPTPVDSSVSTLRISFNNVVGNQGLVLDNNWYVNENGDSFQVNIFKYYISNISVTRDDDSVFKEPDSYHLIDQSVNASRSFLLSKVPRGNYKKITFLIGVDADRNTSGAQTGALDPANTMFWDWVTGYIMAKIEGISPSSTVPTKNIAFHMGGFQGPSNVLRWVTLTFPSDAAVQVGGTPNVHILADVLEWFKTPNLIDFEQVNNISQAGPEAAAIADNYADMFTVDHID
jgi:hypothetical protein